MGQEAQELLAGTAKWTEKIYDMHWDEDDSKNEVKQYIKANGENDIVYIEYNYKQLGLSDEWFRNISKKIGNPLVVKREILLQRLRGSSDSPFDQEDIEYIVNAVQSIVEELFILDHFRFDIYKPLNRTTPYIVGVDCSTGTNSDNNAITIIDPYTTNPVGEFKCPYIGETQYEQLLIELVKDHIPRAILCIERNSVGDSIIDHLLNSPIRQNLYYDKDKDLVTHNMKDNETITSMLKKQAEMKKYYGVWTGTQSREDMMTILFRRMLEYKDKFIMKELTDDIAHLVRKTSGKIEAGPGFHDDNVMSYLIGMYVYYHGNNLAMFGFVKGSEEIKEPNRGLTYKDVENSNILPRVIIETMKQQEAVRAENNYEEMMRKAIIESQAQSRLLNEKGLVKSQVFDDTPNMLLEENDYLNGDIPMDLFNELNGF